MSCSRCIHPSNYINTKHKKSENNIKIEFERGRDILKTVSEKYKGIFMVGFAAETNSLEMNTIEKLNNKKLDVIVGNIANHEKGLGFESDYNEVVIFSKNSSIEIKYDKKIKYFSF